MNRSLEAAPEYWHILRAILNSVALRTSQGSSGSHPSYFNFEAYRPIRLHTDREVKKCGQINREIT